MSTPQRILITGTSSGFGWVTTLKLLERGHTVFATMRDIGARNADNADRLRKEAAQRGGHLELLELDVTDEASVNAAVATAEKAHGGIDVAWNNAGLAPMGIAEGFTPEQLARALDTNVVGVQRVNRAVLPGMRARKSGLLIHTGSTMGRIVWPFAGLYTATKFALEGLVESLAYELSGSGVDVCLIQPGAFATELLEKIDGPAEPARIESYGALGERPDAFWGPFMEALIKDGPPPSLVADAVAELVELPPGQRPLRRVVDEMGARTAVETLNRAASDVQRQLLTDAGAAALLVNTD